MEVLNLLIDVKNEEDIIKLCEDKSFDIQNLCRICLKINSKLKYSLFEPYGDQAPYLKIMLLSQVSISPHDNITFPSYMCAECKRQLEMAEDFRAKCQNSDTILKKVLSRCKDVCDENQFYRDSEEGKLNIDYIKKEGADEVLHDDIPLNTLATFKECDGDSICDNLDSVLSDETDQVLDNIKVEFDIDPVDKLEFISETSKQRKNACKVCNKLLKTKLSLLSHMRKYHVGKPSKVVPYRIDGYGKERKFWCSFCEYATKRKQGIMGHIRTHTGEKPFKCAECSMHFPTSSALCNHKKVHSDQMNHTCPQCGKQFRMKSKYEVHKSVHTSEKKFQCHVCNKLLKSKITLQIHLNRHDNIKNYSCETCGATFVTSSELISHSKSHGGEKKFKCTVCSFMTQTKAALEAHLLRHTGERKYQCSRCDIKCFTPAALRNHMIKHTKEKRYPCLFCEQKFAHSSSLNRHMFKTHEKKCKWMDLVDRRVVK